MYPQNNQQYFNLDPSKNTQNELILNEEQEHQKYQAINSPNSIYLEDFIQSPSKTQGIPYPQFKSQLSNPQNIDSIQVELSQPPPYQTQSDEDIFFNCKKAAKDPTPVDYQQKRTINRKPRTVIQVAFLIRAYKVLDKLSQKKIQNFLILYPTEQIKSLLQSQEKYRFLNEEQVNKLIEKLTELSQYTQFQVNSHNNLDRAQKLSILQVCYKTQYDYITQFKKAYQIQSYFRTQFKHDDISNLRKKIAKKGVRSKSNQPIEKILQEFDKLQ